MIDYEKKYKEALELARDYYKANLKLNNADENLLLEDIFPELKESEDEKIRKALVRFHKSTIDIDGIKGADILAWLEKQGDNNNQNWKPSKEQINALEHFVRSIGESGYTSPYDDNTNLLNSLINDLYKLEKQGEQKPTVLDFKASNFYVSKVDGKIHDITYNPADKVEPKFKVKYAGSEYNVLEVKDIAGVTFYGIEDEPNHIDYVKAENCEIISGYAIKENGSPYPTKSAVFSEQKQEWSEEDKEMLDRIDDSLEAYATKVRSEKDYELEEILKEEQSWLYSLKDRILPQPKQEWSEEDNNFMYDTLSNLTELKDRYGDGYGKVGKCIEWLKSLKDRIGG